MVERIQAFIHDRSISLRDRLFRLIAFVGVVLSIFALLSEVILYGFRPSEIFISLTFISFLTCLILAYKYNKNHMASCLFGIIVLFILFPGIFIFSGGVNGGASVWLVLSFVYIFLMFKGREFVAFLVSDIAMCTIVYTIDLLKPNWIVKFQNETSAATDSYLAVLLVGISIGLIIMFQKHLFEEERADNVAKNLELEAVSKSKDIFFANMSHEIRTPVNTIIGMNEMILREDISDEIAENALNIKNASSMLLGIVNDILDFSQLESGKMQVVPVEYETATMLTDLINMISLRASQAGLEFNVEADENLPSILYGDVNRIKQVGLNLLTNAVKYTEQGSITLRCSGTQTGPDSIMLTLSVADTGIGIRKEDTAQLFDYFKRLEVDRNIAIEGSGLGLNICADIMTLMGGQIMVDSIYTKGSTFTITLEQSIVSHSPMGSISVENRKVNAKTKYEKSFEAPEAKILVVDDNEMNRLVVTKLLRATKVQIDQASSGMECLDKTQNNSYHLIFMDHMMPIMDGVETMKAVKNQVGGMSNHAAMIALTANVEGDTAMLYKDLGFDDYLSKPVSGQSLEQCLVRYLPDEVIEYRAHKVEDSAENSTRVVVSGQRKKKNIAITTGVSADIPTRFIEKYDIHQMYNYVGTDYGRFCDQGEVDAENLIDFMKKQEHTIELFPPSVEEYEAFFANELSYAENVIYVTSAESKVTSTENAIEAAKGFDHVTIIPTQQFSTGVGLMAMKFADWAKAGYTIDEILDNYEEVDKRVKACFLIKDIDTFAKNSYMPNFYARFYKLFELQPMIICLKDHYGLRGIAHGDWEESCEKYVKHVLGYRTKKINNDMLVLVHSGLKVEEQRFIIKEARKIVPFKEVHVVLESSTSSISFGVGNFGLIFSLRK